MAETLTLPDTKERETIYESLLPQIINLTTGEPNLVANLANISAILKEAFGFFWIGFYLVDSPEELVLGPFQGTLACTRIKLGKGVCGSTWQKRETIIVPDVELFPGHIACSSASKSEIVVPVFNINGAVAMVLDIDSDKLNDFSETDQRYLEKMASHISTLL